MHTQPPHRQRCSLISILIISGLFVLLFLVHLVTISQASPHTIADGPPLSSIDWQPVDQAMGKSGSIQPGGVYHYRFPRTDLHVQFGSLPLNAAFALGTHAEFLPIGSHAMIMGDLMLTEDEVNSVITTLQQQGIQQTALHNHLLGETPRIMYLHIEGQGDPVQLAQGIHGALAQTGTPLHTPPPSGPLSPSNLMLFSRSWKDQY